MLQLPRESGKLPQVIADVGCATKNHIAFVLTAAKNLT